MDNEQDRWCAFCGDLHDQLFGREVPLQKAEDVPLDTLIKRFPDILDADQLES